MIHLASRMRDLHNLFVRFEKKNQISASCHATSTNLICGRVRLPPFIGCEIPRKGSELHNEREGMEREATAHQGNIVARLEIQHRNQARCSPTPSFTSLLISIDISVCKKLVPHSSSLNTLIFTSCAIVRSLNPRAFIRSTNAASILKTLICISSSCVGE